MGKSVASGLMHAVTVASRDFLGDRGGARR